MSPPIDLAQSSTIVDTDIHFSLEEDEDKYLSSFKSIKKTEIMIEDDMIGVGSFSSNGFNIEPIESFNRSQADTGIDSEMLSNLSISTSPIKNSERNNSISATSDDMSDFDLGNSEDLTNFNAQNATVVYRTTSSDLNDEENSNRRDTLIFVVKNDGENEVEAKFQDSKSQSSDNDNLTAKNIPYECASLTSLYSSYSQIDFAYRNAPSPTPQDQTLSKNENQSSSLSSFLGIFGSKNPNSQNKFDLLTSKLFGFKAKAHLPKNQIKSLSSADALDSSCNSKISNQINNSCQDLKVPDSMLIFENRPR